MMPLTLNTHTKVKTFWKDEMKIESELGFLVPSWQIPHKKPGHVRILGIHSRAHERTRSTEHTHPHPLTTQKTFRMDQVDVRASGRVSFHTRARAPVFRFSPAEKPMHFFRVR